MIFFVVRNRVLFLCNVFFCIIVGSIDFFFWREVFCFLIGEMVEIFGVFLRLGDLDFVFLLFFFSVRILDCFRRLVFLGDVIGDGGSALGVSSCMCSCVDGRFR